VYPDERVARFITQNLIPARVHVRENADEFRRLAEQYGEIWTPTLLIVEADGTLRHRIEGFLPADELIAQLRVGLGHAAFKRRQWPEAERQFRAVVDEYPATGSAPEALYWSGVSRYKESNDPGALADTARQFTNRYEDSTWAKRSSVWLPQPAATT
jgi:hypothetical protein